LLACWLPDLRPSELLARWLPDLRPSDLRPPAPAPAPFSAEDSCPAEEKESEM